MQQHILFYIIKKHRVEQKGKTKTPFKTNPYKTNFNKNKIQKKGVICRHNKKPQLNIQHNKTKKKTYEEVGEIDDGPSHARRATEDGENKEPREEED